MAGRGKEEEGYSVEAKENMEVALQQFAESLIPIGSEEANKNVFFNKVESADPILKAVIRTLSLRLNDSNKKSEEIWKQLHLLSSIKKDIEKD